MPAFAGGRRLLALVPVVLVSMLGVSLLSATPAQAHRTERERRIHHGLEVAIRQKGDPYVYGADGPGAFDCSGLTMFAFGKAGLHLPRSSDSQARYVRRIPKKNLRRGDFVFFHSRGGGVYHVAIYLGHRHGHRLILHAPHSGTVVRRDRIWTHAWYAGTLRRRP
jgi:cell wall-associated NlpC family hydrolase